MANPSSASDDTTNNHDHHELNSLVRHSTHRDNTDLHTPLPSGSATETPRSLAPHDAADGASINLWSMAAKRALGGGLGGAVAMAIQVTTLMPFHTGDTHCFVLFKSWKYRSIS